MKRVSCALACALLCTAAGAFAAEPIPATMPMAEIMEKIVMPAADVLWGATAVVMTEHGEEDRSPKNDAEWQKVEDARLRLAEAAEALLDTSRPVDVAGAVVEHPEENLTPEQIAALIREQSDDWMKQVQAFAASVEKSKQSIADHDVDVLLEDGGLLYESCDSCHKQFWYPKH